MAESVLPRPPGRKLVRMAAAAAPDAGTDLGDGWRAGVRRDDAALDELAAEWAELYARCPGATPFQSSAWLTAWWRHYGRAGALRLAVVRRDGRLVGLGAFSATRRLGVPALLPLG